MAEDSHRPPSEQAHSAVPSVWVADQDELFRGSLAQALRQDGARVVELAAGGELGASAAGGEPDLIVLATDRDELDGCQMYTRLKSPSTGRQFPLVLVTHKSRPLDEIVSSVRSFLADWNRLCVRNLAGVLALLQVRQASGRFEVEGFGSRGTILLREGEVLLARWRSLQGREVLKFLAESLPNVGFRFAERLEPPPEAAKEAPRQLPSGQGQREDPSLRRFWLEQARQALFDPRGLDRAFLCLRIAEDAGTSAEASPGEVQFLLGLAHLRSGDLDLAADELRTASQALPGDPRVAAALAEALHRLEELRAKEPAQGAAAAPPRDRPVAPSSTPAADRPSLRSARIESAAPVARERSPRFPPPPLLSPTPTPEPILSRAMAHDQPRVSRPMDPGPPWRTARSPAEAAATEPVIDESAPASHGIEIDPVIEEHAPAILSGAAGRAAPGAREWYPDAVVLPGVPVRHRAPHRLLLRASRWAEDAAGLVGLLVLLTILTWGPLSRAVTALARGSGPATVTLEGKEPAGIVAQRAVPAPQSASAARGGASDVDGSKDASQDDRSPAPEPEPPVNPGNSRPIESAALRPTAEMRVLVTSEGWVQEVQVLRSSGDRELDQRAMARIHQLTYVPARRNGAPAAVWIRQPVVFNVR